MRCDDPWMRLPTFEVSKSHLCRRKPFYNDHNHNCSIMQNMKESPSRISLEHRDPSKPNWQGACKTSRPVRDALCFGLVCALRELGRGACNIPCHLRYLNTPPSSTLHFSFPHTSHYSKFQFNVHSDSQLISS